MATQSLTGAGKEGEPNAVPTDTHTHTHSHAASDQDYRGARVQGPTYKVMETSGQSHTDGSPQDYCGHGRRSSITLPHETMGGGGVSGLAMTTDASS